VLVKHSNNLAERSNRLARHSNRLTEYSNDFTEHSNGFADKSHRLVGHPDWFLKKKDEFYDKTGKKRGELNMRCKQNQEKPRSYLINVQK
jgi:hypothetical protein